MSVTEDWEQFRQQRDTDLPEPHGWLSLTSFQWLPAKPCGLRGLPGKWCADDAGAHVSAKAADGLTTVDDEKPINGKLTARVAEGDSLNWVQYGTTLVELIVRNGRYAVRTRNSEAQLLQDFDGVPVFGYQPEARVAATFKPFNEPETRTISTANPEVSDEATFVGTLIFQLEGGEHRLLAQQSGDKLLVNFSDTSSGKDTAQWRFVTTKPLTVEQLHGQQEVTLDFNYALNWPSGFTAYGTCPKAEPENALSVPVLAGEKFVRN